MILTNTLNIQCVIAAVGLGRSSNDAPVFGQEENSTKSKVIQLIGAVQTLLRSMSHKNTQLIRKHL